MKIKMALVSLPLGLAGCPLAGGGNCGTHHADFVTMVDGGLDDAGCATQCLAHATFNGFAVTSCAGQAVDGGLVQIGCDYVVGCTTGRRPAGFASTTIASCDEIGGWLAHSAALEAASVAAFQILAGELLAHGAPAPLIEAARRSAGDEEVHAREVARLARRWGALPGPVEIAARPIRSLEEIAVENAVEGGVRERYGAHLALAQSQAAADAETRALYGRIAPDELRHAQLAAAIDEWSANKLGAAARARVDDAKQAARARLAGELAKEPSPSLKRLGLPEATRAVELLDKIG